MTGLDATVPGPAEAPAMVRHNRDAIDQIVRCVEDGDYCAVLGPRLSGKTMISALRGADPGPDSRAGPASTLTCTTRGPRPCRASLPT